jgi:glutamate dehydrogenase
MPRHPLKREIVSTVVANTMINRTGSTFVFRMQQETGATSEEVTRAFILVRDVFGMDGLWSEIDALDNKVPAALQNQMLTDAGGLVLRATLWFLRRRRERLPIEDVIKVFEPAVGSLRSRVPAILSSGDRMAREEYVEGLESKGVPQPLAERLGSLAALYAALDLTEVAIELKRDPSLLAALYFELVGELQLRWFAEKIGQLPTDTPWQALARNALRDDLSSTQRALTTALAKMSPDSSDPVAILAAWKERYASALTRLASMTEELKHAGSLDLAVLSVLLRELRSLA